MPGCCAEGLAEEVGNWLGVVDVAKEWFLGGADGEGGEFLGVGCCFEDLAARWRSWDGEEVGVCSRG